MALPPAVGDAQPSALPSAAGEIRLSAATWLLEERFAALSRPSKRGDRRSEAGPGSEASGSGHRSSLLRGFWETPPCFFFSSSSMFGNAASGGCFAPSAGHGRYYSQRTCEGETPCTTIPNLTIINLLLSYRQNCGFYILNCKAKKKVFFIRSIFAANFHSMRLLVIYYR